MSGLGIASYFPFTRVKVVARNVHAEGALIQVHPDLRWHPLCHDCRTPAATVHSQGYRRMVRDLNLADRQVWLQVAYRKVWCPRCGKARVEHLRFCDSPQRLTHRLRHHCPQALIVFDLFHVVEGFGFVIDEVRREEVRRAVGPMKRFVKGSRYLLLKNRENLRPDQADRLEELLKINENLNRVYVLKDQSK